MSERSFSYIEQRLMLPHRASFFRSEIKVPVEDDVVPDIDWPSQPPNKKIKKKRTAHTSRSYILKRDAIQPHPDLP